MDEQRHRRRRSNPDNRVLQHNEAIQKPIICEETPKNQGNRQQSNKPKNYSVKKKRINSLLISAVVIEGLIIVILVSAIGLFILNGWIDKGLNGLIAGIVSTPTPIPVSTPTPTPLIEYIYVTPSVTTMPISTPELTSTPSGTSGSSSKKFVTPKKTASKSTSNSYSSKKCEECGKTATFTIEGLFSGLPEHYCTDHYYQLRGMMDYIGL